MKEWDQYFYYDINSKSCLKWKVDRYTGYKQTRLLVAANSDAGSILTTKGRHNKYWRVTLNGENILVHRIIYYLHNRTIDNALFIDHIDGDGLNNNISNLRLVSQDVNARNAKRREDNKSGITGVCLKTEIDGNKVRLYWIVQWQDLVRKTKSKCFSVNKYGYDNAFNLACAYREEIMEKLNNLGAQYSERHGNEQ